jgi:prevent-host-death family protein
MTSVTIEEAKTRLAELVEQVERGEEVIITRGKKPVARLVRYIQGCPSAASAR